MYGFSGTIAFVDLTSGKVTLEHPPLEIYRKYLGGSALNMYYMMRYMQGGVNPLAPESLLCFAVGPATSLPIAGQSRLTITAKSPLTGAIGDSQGGGYFPAEMKKAGFDALILYGKAELPTYIYVHNGVVELHSAESIWLSSTIEVESYIRKRHSTSCKILKTSIAGINGVLFSAIINDCNRAYGRTGMGAVMASKNIRAIGAFGGIHRTPIYDRSRFKSLACQGMEQFSNSMIADMSIFGTSSVVASSQVAGGLATHNYTQSSFDDWREISGTAFRQKLLHENTANALERNACHACMIQCKAVAHVEEGEFKTDSRYGGPEFETIAAFGSFCGISSLEAIAKANELCNKYGMDTLSTGSTIAWLMECYEKKMLKEEHYKLLGDIEPYFGNAHAMVALVEAIAYKQGIGAILAMGSERASEILGIGAEALTTIKGQEIPAHMPHIKRSFAVIYATNPFGPDHQSSCSDQEYELDYPFYKERMEYMGFTTPQPQYSLTAEKIRFARITQYLYSALDSMSVCQFVWGPSWQLYGPKDFVELIQCVTGFTDFSFQEVLDVGKRRILLMRLFNAREGIGKERDTLPSKFFKPLEKGKKGAEYIDKEEFLSAKEELYRQSKWDLQTGYPTREALEDAELHEFIPLLDSLSISSIL